jgi:DNA-directed RNA polymerase subunit RPC12/RpoP
MDNYLCKKCSTLIQSDKNPTSLGCPEGSTHQWTKVAKVGTINYQCKKCATLIKAAAQPTSLGCPEGSTHQWTKL